MKIRTDFVTNSSSSSFISYSFDTTLLNEFLKEHGMKPYSSKNKRERIVNEDWEDGFSYDCLGQAVIAEYSGLGFFDADDEYDIWGMSGCGHDDYKTHKWENSYDGTEESAINVLKELFEYTDFENHLDFTCEKQKGGGEMHCDTLLDFTSSGYTMVTHDGLITEYNAHTYEGGFGYDQDAPKFIEYSDKTLNLYDAHSGSDSYNDIIWKNEDVARAFQTILRQTVGLEVIDRFKMAQVDRIDIPAQVQVVCSGAFEECENLKVLYVLGYETSLEDNVVNEDVEIIAHGGTPAEEYAQKHGNKFTPLTDYQPIVTLYGYAQWPKYTPRNYKEALEKYDGKYICKTKILQGPGNYDNPSYFITLNPDSYDFATEDEADCWIYDKYIVNATYKKVLTGTFPFGESIYFGNKDTEIEPDGVAKCFHIYVLGHGKVEEYAKANGNELTIIPDTELKNLSYTVENDTLRYSFQTEFKIMGLTAAKKKTMKDKADVEIVHDGEDHLNSMRVAFKLKGNNDALGVMNYSIANIIAYLMDKGYVRFERSFIWKEKVSATVIIEYPLGRELADALHRYELHRKYVPEFLESVMHKEAQTYSDIWMDKNNDMKKDLYWIIDYIYCGDSTEKRLKKLSEPYNRLAYCFKRSLNYFVAFKSEGLDKYTVGNEYNSSTVRIKKGQIFIGDDSEPAKGNELDFAKAYINHYNRLYGLAELDLDAKEEE